MADFAGRSDGGSDARSRDDASLGTEGFDAIIEQTMREHGVPAGAVAVARDGVLIHQTGYRHDDPEASVPSPSETYFRVASVSKPITAAAVLLLVEQGELSLTDAAWPHLGLEGEPTDPRFATITIDQLLTHTAGFDRDVSGDPMFRSGTIARDEGVSAPAELPAIVSWMSKQNLDFAPGERYAYSNFGYALLGLVIESVTEQSYEQWVQENLLVPAGATKTELGRTLPGDRPENEVDYFSDGEAASVFDGETVPRADGTFFLEPMAAHGGWISTAEDLVRIFLAVDGFDTVPDVLSAESVELMHQAPSISDWEGQDVKYARGVSVRGTRDGVNVWHTGALNGTTAIVVRTSHGYVWAGVFNRWPNGNFDFHGAIDQAFWRAIDAL